MKKIKMNWPKRNNLRILETILTEEKLLKLIVEYQDRPYKARQIILPSRRTCKKIFAHQIFSRIFAGQSTWAEEKKEFCKKIGGRNLRLAGIRKDKLLALFSQREREIKNEK